MTVLLQLTTAGSDVGPFDLYSNLDGYVTPFETGVSRADLLLGYSATTVPDYTSIIRIISTGVCKSSLNIILSHTTTSTTSTTTTTTPECTLAIISTVTTDPDNMEENNGTATVTFSGGTGPFTYTLNGTPIGAATSPLLITDLLASTFYEVVITDSLACTATASFTLGESSFSFDADYIMLTYEFTDGLDLDTRTRIAIPDIGQDTQPEYLGWSLLTNFPITGTPILSWGGDNTGIGFESVLININEFKLAYPAATSLVIDARCFWFNTIGVNPVNVAATLWKGGTPVKDGCLASSVYYCWTNVTADNEFSISSVPTIITSDGLPVKADSSGQRAATLTYDLLTNIGVLNNNDTTTPSV